MTSNLYNEIMNQADFVEERQKALDAVAEVFVKNTSLYPLAERFEIWKRCRIKINRGCIPTFKNKKINKKLNDDPPYFAQAGHRRIEYDRFLEYIDGEFDGKYTESLQEELIEMNLGSFVVDW